jgi:hypothetical protein
MLVYRVFPHLPSAVPGTPGHATYLHNGQGRGRLDNPSHYYVWYLSYDPCGAIGETFGNLETWSSAMFSYPRIAGSKRALAIYVLPDDLSIIDLNDAQNLLAPGLRPTQVVERNRSATQAWALRIFDECNTQGQQMWQGVTWWSFHRPQWRLLGCWASITPTLVSVEPLDTKHYAVADTAATLRKVFV